MAEAVGVVAAALEIGKVVLEVKHLYSSLKHAPETLQQLLDDLDTLEEILQTLADQDAVLSAYAPPDVVRKCRQRCEKAVKSVKPMCDQLSKSVSKARMRGAMKVLLKEDALEKARQAVERAKADLILAQMTLLKYEADSLNIKYALLSPTQCFE